MIRIDYACPFCGQIIGDDMPSEADWTITTDYDHEPDRECVKGCARVSWAAEWTWCDHCDEEVYLIVEYTQPCNANGYVTRANVYAAELL